MKILAIDIGYHNMGLVLAESLTGPSITIEYMKKVNLEDYKYLKTNDFVDLVPLFVEDHQHIFDAAEKILIERQPRVDSRILRFFYTTCSEIRLNLFNL